MRKFNKRIFAVFYV